MGSDIYFPFFGRPSLRSDDEMMHRLEFPECRDFSRAVEPVNHELPITIPAALVFGLIDRRAIRGERINVPLIVVGVGKYEVGTQIEKYVDELHFIPFFGRPGLRTRTAAAAARSDLLTLNRCTSLPPLRNAVPFEEFAASSFDHLRSGSILCFGCMIELFDYLSFKSAGNHRAGLGCWTCWHS
jgi:hypothetical protein